MDLVPTILEMAGLQHPGTAYKGLEIAGLRGRSWLIFLCHKVNDSLSTQKIRDDDYAVEFEVAGSGALCRGDWKITFVPAPRGPQKWGLFNIKTDPGDTKNVAEEYPSLFEELMELWDEYNSDVGVVGVAGEYPISFQGDNGPLDEFEGPCAWIKYIGRPGINPSHLKDVVPSL